MHYHPKNLEVKWLAKFDDQLAIVPVHFDSVRGGSLPDSSPYTTPTELHVVFADIR